MRLVAYLRTSTSGGSGDSLAAQEEACREWAAERCHEVALVQSDEGISGGLGPEDRPGLAGSIVEVEAGRADGLLTVLTAVALTCAVTGSQASGAVTPP